MPDFVPLIADAVFPNYTGETLTQPSMSAHQQAVLSAEFVITPMMNEILKLQALANGNNLQEVRNETGGALTIGTMVQLSGYNTTEDKHLISKANPTDVLSQTYPEYALDADIADNANGTARAVATITGTAGDNFDTNSFTEGDLVFCASTGAIQGARNDAGPVGVVTVKSATLGAVAFFLPGKLDQLSLRNLGQGHKHKLELSNAADADHDIDVGSGECRDKDNGTDIVLGTSITSKALDSVWAAGNATGGNGTLSLNGATQVTFTDGGGGNDSIDAASGTPFSAVVAGDTLIITGSASNNGTFQALGITGGGLGVEVGTGLLTAEGPVSASVFVVEQSQTYHCFVIMNAAGNIDFGFDTALNGSNLLTTSTYSFARRIGSVLTDTAANIIGFSQYGSHFTINNPIDDVNDLNPGTSGVLAVMSAPTGVQVLLQINTSLTSSVLTGFLYISSPDADDEVPNIPAPGTFYNFAATAVTQVGGENWIRTDTNARIRYRSLNSDANTRFRIITQGWIEDFTRAL